MQGYDILHRAIRMWARDDADSQVTVRERMVYGDGGDPNQSPNEREANRQRNRLGQLWQYFDEAGLLTFEAYDFKGNLLEKARQVISDEAILSIFPQPADPNPDWDIAPFRVNWQPPLGLTLAQHAANLLDATAYRTSMTYDALNRVKGMFYPQDVEGERKQLRPHYNRAGALEQVRLDDEVYVERIAYNAKGQRGFLVLGNGIITRYAYDPDTFRLARLRSERYAKPNDTTYQPGGTVLQDFAYECDLVGNILHIRDRAPDSGIPNSPLGTQALDRDFGYDAIYRLTSATGREHAKDPAAFPWDERPKTQDITRTQPYLEEYEYDPVGNMHSLQHTASSGGFTRNFAMRVGTNQLDELTIGSNPNSPFRYSYDENGNMLGETTSRHFEWDHSDQMKVFRNQPGQAEPSIHAHYLYDAGGQRVKKLVRRQGGGFETTTYIDGIFEHQRWGSAPNEQNSHLQVMDDQQRIALVRMGLPHPDDRGPAVQYHLGDHLDSSNVVVNQDGSFINREEHTPYGETSFGSFSRKRYRYSGKERDRESSLNYHSARYYAPWLAQWCSTDKNWGASPNLYSYVSNNPLTYNDPTGLDKEDTESKQSFSALTLPNLHGGESVENIDYSNLFSFRYDLGSNLKLTTGLSGGSFSLFSKGGLGASTSNDQWYNTQGLFVVATFGLGEMGNVSKTVQILQNKVPVLANNTKKYSLTFGQAVYRHSSAGSLEHNRIGIIALSVRRLTFVFTNDVGQFGGNTDERWTADFQATYSINENSNVSIGYNDFTGKFLGRDIRIPCTGSSDGCYVQTPQEQSLNQSIWSVIYSGSNKNLMIELLLPRQFNGQHFVHGKHGLAPGSAEFIYEHEQKKIFGLTVGFGVKFE